MSIDREIIREVWNGKIPVCFQMCADDVFGIQQPDPVYLMVPRLSYFPLVTDKVKKHFVRYLEPGLEQHELWLEHNGQALKWHYPIGLLFDIVCACDTNGPVDQLPWTLTVHFRNFPATEIFRFYNKDAIESYFMSRLKEADSLKHKKPIVTYMQKRDHNQLWTGLQNDKFDQFWAINNRLMEKDSSAVFKYIPFLCYFDDDQAHYKQCLIKPISKDGQKRTLSDLLKVLFPSKSVERIRVQGISPPLNTSLQWMSEHLSYADNFLHLYVTLSSS